MTGMQELQLLVEADADGARRAAVAVQALLTGVDPTVVVECELAVAEACTNVARHAYGGDKGPLRVVLRHRPGRFSAAVCDRGAPFAPDPAAADLPHVTAQSGRGLALLGLCMGRHSWQRCGDENRLLMSRVLPEGC